MAYFNIITPAVQPYGMGIFNCRSNNIVKSWRSRTAKGKSVQFKYIVLFGYLVGLLGKIITAHRTGVLPWSTWFYIADIIMVAIDVALYFRNTALDRQRGESA